MGDPQGTTLSNIMDKLGLGAPVPADPNDPKVKIMRDILATICSIWTATNTVPFCSSIR
jgi:hypothetical protein